VTSDALGVLDTSTLILIDRLEPASLPAEPVITAVTLAEFSVGPSVACTRAVVGTSTASTGCGSQAIPHPDPRR